MIATSILVAFISLWTAGVECDEKLFTGLEISMCRLRNCTIAQDLRIEAAKAGFSSILGFKTAYNPVFGCGWYHSSFASGHAYGSSAFTFTSVMPRFSRAVAIAQPGRSYYPQQAYAVQYAPHGKQVQEVQYSEEKKTSIVLKLQEEDDEQEDLVTESSVSTEQASPSIDTQAVGAPVAQRTPMETPTIQNRVPNEDQNQSQQEEPVCEATPFARINVTAELSILKRAVETVQVVDILSDPNSQLTLFAPTNDAFGTLLQRLGEGDMTLEQLFDNVNLLATILLLHIVPDQAIFTADLTNGQELDTVLSQEEKLTVDIDSESGLITIIPPQELAAADIIVPDVESCRSVVHVINGVLLGSPPVGGSSPEVARISDLAIDIPDGLRKLLQHQDNQDACTKGVMEVFKPCCAVYNMKIGESACALADRFGLTCDQLLDFNGFTSEDEANDVRELQIC